MSLEYKYKNKVLQPKKNMYISDSDKAVQLMSHILNDDMSTYNIQLKIFGLVDELFEQCNNLTINNELSYYQHFRTLCDRLNERHKLNRIDNKTIISLGGKFSAGKSKFINAISNVGNLLPVSQSPTTSIPTYIIKGESLEIIGNNTYGQKIELTTESMKALSHEFADTYSIGFSQFMDSILIATPDYSIDQNIVLLDTPGYTKYDSESETKNDFSDRARAYEQLKITDYLIWLIDIENGELTLDDIQFINRLDIKTPILIVFNKADIKTETDRKKILNKAKEIAKRELSQPLFGITAYSSTLKKEYEKDLITEFLNYALQNNQHSNDILEDFEELEQKMRTDIVIELLELNNLVNEIKEVVNSTNDALNIKSLADLFIEKSLKISELSSFLNKYDSFCNKLNRYVKKVIN